MSRLLHPCALRRLAVLLVLVVPGLEGCGHLRSHRSHEYVYVWQREMYLRDRVAPVNQRVARVANGDRLEVLEQDGRFMKVKAPDGTVGWLAGETVIDQQTYEKFAQLAKENEHAPVLSKGVLLYGYWMRDAPGRQSDRFYWLKRNEKLDLLRRASVPKPATPGLLPETTKDGKGSEPPAPEMEDYWLARDSAGHVGWVRGGDLDEDAPRDIEELDVGEKVLEARVLRTVTDPESDRPDHQVPEYVVALGPWRAAGLPYDFDQLRVFTWNVRKHRWETAFRDRDLQAYLPITVSQEDFKGRTDPTFSFRVATDNSAHLDPRTGYPEAGSSATEVYRLEDTVVRKVSGPDVQRSDEARKKISSRKNRHHGQSR